MLAKQTERDERLTQMREAKRAAEVAEQQAQAPRISAASRCMAERRRAAAGVAEQSGPVGVLGRGLAAQARKEEKTERLRSQLQARADAELTGRPSINKASERIMRSRGALYGQTAADRTAAWEKKRKAKLEARRAAARAQQASLATGHPRIDKRSAQLAANARAKQAARVRAARLAESDGGSADSSASNPARRSGTSRGRGRGRDNGKPSPPPSSPPADPKRPAEALGSRLYGMAAVYERRREVAAQRQAARHSFKPDLVSSSAIREAARARNPGPLAAISAAAPAVPSSGAVSPPCASDAGSVRSRPRSAASSSGRPSRTARRGSATRRGESPPQPRSSGGGVPEARHHRRGLGGAAPPDAHAPPPPPPPPASRLPASSFGRGRPALQQPPALPGGQGNAPTLREAMARAMGGPGSHAAAGATQPGREDSLHGHSSPNHGAGAGLTPPRPDAGDPRFGEPPELLLEQGLPRAGSAGRPLFSSAAPPPRTAAAALPAAAPLPGGSAPPLVPSNQAQARASPALDGGPRGRRTGARASAYLRDGYVGGVAGLSIAASSSRRPQPSMESVAPPGAHGGLAVSSAAALSPTSDAWLLSAGQSFMRELGQRRRS